MTRDEAIAEVQRGLGFRTDKNDEIAAAMRQAQRLLEMGKTLPWFLLEENATLSLAADSDTVDLPTDFLREVERSGGIRFQEAGATGWTWVVKYPHDEARSEYFTTDAGYPRYYVLRRDSILVDRPASVATTLYWDYYKKGTVLDTNLENEWLEYAPDVLIGAAGRTVSSFLGGFNKAHFDELFTLAWDAVLKETVTRPLSNRRIVLGRNT